jgi:hypothetical protein
MEITLPDIAKIRALNDQLRTSFTGGKIAATPGVLGIGKLPAILEQLSAFSEFDPGNDPYHEHDFGAFKVAAGDGSERLVFFKIDYYDPELMMGSPDPADPTLTARILTLMLAEEY